MDTLFGITPPSFQGNLTEFHFIDGIFHGFVFSIPFSAPVLICISRFFLQGPLFGFLSFLGTVVGQLCFFFLLCGNSRTSISIWYTLEPFLALFGSALAFGFATNLWSMTSKGSQWGSSGDFFLLARPAGETFSRSRFAESNSTSSDGVSSTSPGMNQKSESMSARFQNLGSYRFDFFNTRFTFTDITKIFGLNFLLMFLNPAMPATSSRVLFSSPQLFDYSYGSYSLGFFCMAFISICLIWPLVFSISIQIIQKGFILFSSKETPVGSSSSGQNFFKSFFSTLSKKWNSESFHWGPSSKATKFLSFLIVGCIMSGTLHYSWRLFTQYPLEAITSMTSFRSEAEKRPVGSPTGSARNQFEESHLTPTSSALGVQGRTPKPEPKNSERYGGEDGANGPEGKPPITESGGNFPPNSKGQPLGTIGETQIEAQKNQGNDWGNASLREFPSFDSNIRHRDKNLPSDRFLPIEKMNSRRTLGGRPPLTEEQKSDAYLKFHSFFINSLEKHLENKMIFSRLPEKQNRDVSQIEYLQNLKNELNKDSRSEASSASQGVLGRSPKYFPSSSIPLLARPIENNTKGKRPQGFSYVRTLISSENPESYIHDELQIYRVLFGTAVSDAPGRLRTAF